MARRPLNRGVADCCQALLGCRHSVVSLRSGRNATTSVATRWCVNESEVDTPYRTIAESTMFGFSPTLSDVTHSALNPAPPLASAKVKKLRRVITWAFLHAVGAFLRPKLSRGGPEE